MKPARLSRVEESGAVKCLPALMGVWLLKAEQDCAVYVAR